jgi:hypothetical protein
MSDPIYTSDDRPAASSLGVHLPLSLLALTLAVFLAAQIGAAQSGGKVMRWQLENVDKQIENVKTAQKQYGESIQKRDEMVKQAGQVQQQYTALLNEVLDLAKDDEDARTVVPKWGIQRNQAAAASSGDAAGGSAGGDKPAGQ